MNALMSMVQVLTTEPTKPEPKPRPVKPPRVKKGRLFIPVPVGERYGHLVIMGEGKPYLANAKGFKARRWTCLCDCGKTKDISMNNLRARHRKQLSCGCMSPSIGTRFSSDRNPNARFKV